MTARSFDQWGDAEPDSPVVISVPHAGREYPPVLHSALAVSPDALAGLEDRHIDAVALAARCRETMLVQHLPRAWIDLNRGEDERDPRIDEGAPRVGRANESVKLRSGLGLVPRRAGPSGDLWRRRFSRAEIDARIAAAYRPYHQALGTALAAARARWGVAVLLDLHSMPSLGPGGPQVVIGDRFGRSAANRFVARVETEAVRSGFATALNTPYAGGHILHRHGTPGAGIHAVQLELDRRLYLDAALDRTGPGLADTAALVRRIAVALAEEAVAGRMPVAAE